MSKTQGHVRKVPAVEEYRCISLSNMSNTAGLLVFPSVMRRLSVTAVRHEADAAAVQPGSLDPNQLTETSFSFRENRFTPETFTEVVLIVLI